MTRTKSQLLQFYWLISFAEHWKLAADSSEFHLMLRRAPIFQFEILQKKRDILSEKRESGMVLKKREFTPESGNIDEIYWIYYEFTSLHVF